MFFFFFGWLYLVNVVRDLNLQFRIFKVVIRLFCWFNCTWKLLGKEKKIICNILCVLEKLDFFIFYLV